MSKIVSLGIIGFFAFIFFIVGFVFCDLASQLSVETQIIDVSESEILWDEHDFYIFDPDGNKITLGVDSGEILDLTKHSRVLVKFARYPPVLLSPGSGWFVDGVVKTPNPDNMEGDVE